MVWSRVVPSGRAAGFNLWQNPRARTRLLDGEAFERGTADHGAMLRRPDPSPCDPATAWMAGKGGFDRRVITPRHQNPKLDQGVAADDIG
ncbi:hypothetical protein [Methylobacterium sp. Leaf113]|uniref:hypothetical protein n=1 Tax=Methylobacterium sp. Leaf113 TaxID=1736259 RepID=UPI0012E8E9F0|nr:hypothetical protein [Methylobacterium sp. Leaf113]